MTYETAVKPAAPGVVGLPLRSPTLPPATHTNVWVVGHEDFIVVEPASPYADAQTELDAVIDARLGAGHRLLGLVVTHHHADHVGGAAWLRAKYGAPLLAHPKTAAKLKGRVTVDREVDEGDTIDPRLDALGLQLLATPGHAPGHLCLVSAPHRWAIVGDMVASVGTILIDPDDDGDMDAYLTQLDRLRGLELGSLLPAHGTPIEAPRAHLSHYIAHREAREAKVLAALEVQALPLATLVSRAYADTPVHLWPLASKSARAHLARLARRGQAEAVGRDWRRPQSGA
ncbi:MAG: MBL fold metallo-hydrolase [Myxococcales bacterium]|nr:MBL fold metallo-hydrolase [Myxococcales bacterium]